MSEGITKLTSGLWKLLAGKKYPLPFQRDILILEIHIAGTSYRENFTDRTIVGNWPDVSYGQ